MVPTHLCAKEEKGFSCYYICLFGDQPQYSQPGDENTWGRLALRVNKQSKIQKAVIQLLCFWLHIYAELSS